MRLRFYQRTGLLPPHGGHPYTQTLFYKRTWAIVVRQTTSVPFQFEAYEVLVDPRNLRALDRVRLEPHQNALCSS
jgi:hypothetical protein